MDDLRKYVNNTHLHIRQVLYIRTGKREALSLSCFLFTFVCGEWVYLNSMPIYIQSHMDDIYELGIYNADILNICLPPTV